MIVRYCFGPNSNLIAKVFLSSQLGTLPNPYQSTQKLSHFIHWYIEVSDDNTVVYVDATITNI